MAVISSNALMMAVQAIDGLVARLEAEREEFDGPEQADYDEVIEAYEIAAMEFRKVYEAARREGEDLPPYGSLLLGRPAAEDLSET